MSADKHSPADANPLAMAVLNAVQNPVILVDAEGFIAFANWEAEAFSGPAPPISPATASPPSFLSAVRCLR